MSGTGVLVRANGADTTAPGGPGAREGAVRSAVRFEVLGPVRARGAAGPVRLGTPKARGLLAALLCGANRPVALETLVDALWGEGPPKSATKNIQSYVHRLRRALGDPDRIARTGPGYLLRVRPGELDAHAFERLVREGGAAAREGDDARAARLLREAAAAWRGDDAYACVPDVPLVRAEAQRLAEARFAALRDRIDAELRLGLHAALVPELSALTARHPLREELWERLMTALYRSGRQADALRAFRGARRVLAEEAGLDPGPGLRELQRAILAGDPALAPPVRPSEVLERFMRALDADLPAEDAERAALCHSIVAGRRLIAALDDAAGELLRALDSR
ncbi:AfsR/SARP family transcriptional regulator [Actinomadura violacea]|uniref:AfsR/SARP family transcriptional regulator n=1 Tax=Actinomadura violacea TaxID=2819934 RepID=A0ABS3RVM9_9ACTN|nr:AfsR/SARP family transcriptional regulator [Actinomadura violacea]MBO2460783.1 AfsR/SARP family transcriptional regulator [Actinomadura violacea]